MKRFFYLGTVLFLSLLLSACVSKGTYQQKANEADQLTRDIAQLADDNEKTRQEKRDLQNELTKLNARLVEVLQQNSKLQRNLLAANAEQERKEGDISRHQQQLADMQTTNEQLLATVQDLQIQVEKERIAKEARLAKVKSTYDQLVGALEDEIKRGEITISNLEGQLSVSLPNKVLFDSGKAEIKEAGRKVLKSLGDVVNKFPDKALLIEGHTDNVAISAKLKETFPSNWELSTTRATSVVHFLQDHVGLPGERLVAAGFSQYRPIASNDSIEGRALNRRIQIQLVPYQETSEKQ